MSLRLGELCAGYGGLGMAVEEVFGATTAWFSEYDDAPSKILAHHWPDVPNYGDMTQIDWAAIERADIISGGTPCQDLSNAGRRAGMTEGTRSNLWVQMREAIAIQKPTYVVWENVRGAYSATAASDLEQCPGCMGDTGDGRTVLRALGRVLGDLSDLGYDCQWRGLRAADVGACHGRFRVFVLARNSQVRRGADKPGHSRSPSSEGRRCPGQAGGPNRPAPDSPRLGRSEGRTESAGQLRGLHASLRSYPSTPHAQSGRWGLCKSDDERQTGGEGYPPGNDRLTPVGSFGTQTDWGIYEAAVRRWERIVGRPDPRPTEPTGRNGGERLSPRFTEWMMGLPEGWVTDPAIGISPNEQSKACGNGVVPQQAYAALSNMLEAFKTDAENTRRTA